MTDEIKTLRGVGLTVDSNHTKSPMLNFERLLLRPSVVSLHLPKLCMLSLVAAAAIHRLKTRDTKF